jgi:lysophospholipase L1-like esterase
MNIIRILFAGLALAVSGWGQVTTISDTLTSTVGGGAWTGRITVTLNAPGSAQPLYAGTTSLAGWQGVYCLGVTGSDCTTVTAAGAVTIVLWPTDQITPGGTSYTARYQPTKGAAWSETWVVATGNTKLYQIRSTTVPTPTTTFQPSQLALPTGRLIYGSAAGTGTTLSPGTNGHVLTLSGGLPTWAASSGGVTSITGTANQITASASTGAVTLSLPATITGLTSVTSTGFTGTGGSTFGRALSVSGNVWAMIGDSILNATGAAVDQFPVLVGRHYGTSVSNLGVSGETTVNIAARYASAALSLSPSLVLIEGGTNDESSLGSSAPIKAQLLANYTAMLTANQSAGIRSVVMLIPPATTKSNSRMQVHDDWNISLAALAATYSAAVCDPRPYVGLFRSGGDAGNLWDIATAYDLDGIHFTAAGQQRLSECVIDAINAADQAVLNRGATLSGTASGYLSLSRPASTSVSGRSLYLSASAPAAGATNKDGGAVYISTGATHGTGTSTIELRTAAPTTSGVAEVLPVARLAIAENITLTPINKVTVRQPSGGTGTVFEVLKSDGTTFMSVDNFGNLFASGSYTMSNVAASYGTYIGLAGTSYIQWSNSTQYFATKDLGLARSADGIMEINNGTFGTYRDVRLRNVQWTSSTEATCNSTIRGTVTMVQGGAGVADTLRVCRKDAANNYAWTALY